MSVICDLSNSENSNIYVAKLQGVAGLYKGLPVFLFAPVDAAVDAVSCHFNLKKSYLFICCLEKEVLTFTESNLRALWKKSTVEASD